MRSQHNAENDVYAFNKDNVPTMASMRSQHNAENDHASIDNWGRYRVASMRSQHNAENDFTYFGLVQLALLLQ